MRHEVLKILENDARLSARKISEMTGVPATEVSQIVKQAEKDRLILKYKTVINWDKAGENQIWAMIEISISSQMAVGFDAISEHIYRLPQTRTVYLMSGGYDLMVVAVGRSIQELGEFISQQLATLEGVRGTVTHFVLKRYKEDGEIIEGNGALKRQPVTL